jgi:hypothetical protein
MYILSTDGLYDRGFDRLNDIADFLDDRLEKLCAYSVSSEEADAFGYFDEIEHFLGFGLTAFQTYLTDTASCAGKKKQQTWEFGPKTSSGASKIQIINATANYWKHREEWIFDNGSRQNAIDQLFEEVGYSTAVDYPISGVLTELLSPEDVNFANMLSLVRNWRDELIAKTRAEK